ncbi:phosphotransferase [Lysobacter silvisoli]|uniref:Phosphotransferase n=1 Tax=Lysobacter silvisoli TaxID=2293254 RepID=A0A371JXJ7_9GAMM|nr:phosphotransferase [Lysobacter silvisoli]RDZ26381.1 phosphotransferase [Lysobacter silvisoli]
MRTREAIAALIPHQGLMCLWEEVLAWDQDSIELRSHGHRDPAHPLRSGDRLHAVHLCEYGAQAMAVHGGLLAQQADGAARPGLLVALRGVELHTARIDDLPGAIRAQARKLVDGGDSWQYEFALRHEGELLAQGRAAVMLRPEG